MEHRDEAEPTHEAVQLGDSAHSRAVFYNLTTGLRAYDSFKAQGQREGPRNTEQYLRQHLYMAVGWNHEIHARSAGVRGGIWMNEVLPETVRAANGWVYADYRTNDDNWLEQKYGDGTALPATWQGIGGGSLWHVW